MNSWKIDLPAVVGRGYGSFWRFRGRYRVVKGSRGSKKSKTTALWFIVFLMRIPEANLLVVRRVFRTLKDSCWSDLRWAARRLGVEKQWKFTKEPLEASYLPTGQTIFFRGLDDPMKINSISVSTGQLCWLWLEEAYEITKEADFDMLDEVIRGQTSQGVFKQITITFNPWDERHWLKKRFFDPAESPDILALTRTYQNNEFLDQGDFALFEAMKKRNPKRYLVAGLGEWGVHEGLIFEGFSQRRLNGDEILKQPGVRPIFGLDFGFTNDPTALFCGGVDPAHKILYVLDEHYEKQMTNGDIYAMLCRFGIEKEVILADSAEPKSIEELRRLGARRIKAVKKGPDSVRFGIGALQDYEIIVNESCQHFIREISAYTWATEQKHSRPYPDPKAQDHLMDAMRYAMEDVEKTKRFSFG